MDLKKMILESNFAKKVKQEFDKFLEIDIASVVMPILESDGMSIFKKVVVKTAKITFNVLTVIFKILKMWYWTIPTKFSVLTFFVCCFIIYLKEISSFINNYEVYFDYAIVIPSMISAFLITSAAASSCSNSSESSSTRSINSAIRFRNTQMDIATPQDAVEIYKKTAHLDMISDNSGAYSEGMKKKLKTGYVAKYGLSNPAIVFKEMMKK